MFSSPGETTFFAFSYPHAYCECLARLDRLDRLFGQPPTGEAAASALHKLKTRRDRGSTPAVIERAGELAASVLATARATLGCVRSTHRCVRSSKRSTSGTSEHRRDAQASAALAAT